MSNQSRIGLVATVLIGLLVISGAVMAAEVLLETETEVEAGSETETLESDSEGDTEADTQFDFGYDEDNRYLVVSVEPTEDEDDASECDLEGDVTLSYEVGDDGEVTVSGPEGCELDAIDVTGPAGQVNHGMFMKAFNEYLDGLDLEYGRGCLVSQLAKSGIGIDNQIRTPDPDDDFETTETGTVDDFTTALANCEHGPDNDEDEDEIESESEGRGKGKGKGKPDWAPGPPPWAGKGR